METIVRHRVLGSLGLVAALAFGAVTSASASTPTLGVELQESGSTPFVLTGTSNPLYVLQSFGTFAMNFVVNDLVVNPLSLDLGSLNVSTAVGGTLTIIASATGLTSPLGAIGFLSQFSGNFSGNVVSATLQTYTSNSNTMFGTDTPLSSLSATSGPFETSGSAGATTTAPFSLTEVLNIKTSGTANLSVDASAAAVPEIDPRSGAAAIALVLGVLGLVGERRRRRISPTG